MSIKKSKLSDIVDHYNSDQVLQEAERIFCLNYRKEDFKLVAKCYTKTKEIFEGKFPGYKACNTEYHNFTHTTDAFLAVVRLVDGYNLKGNHLDPKIVINLLIAALFHDIGYIQEKIDSEGTGAKYTNNHVLRSINFLVRHYQLFELLQNQLTPISNMIKCTGLTINIETILFSDESEKLGGIILGTSDILGQMSDREYLERLMFLYYEFREAGIPGYNTEFDIIKKTLEFYETIKKRLDETYNSVYGLALDHFMERFSINENLYVTSIDRNMSYIKKILDDSSTNFRHKLKRGKFSKEKIFA